MRVLLIEDEIMLAEAVELVLKKNNYSVDIAFDGAYGLDCAMSEIYDLIILDLMLPKMDGLSVLREMRREGINTHVILLTARGELEDKVKGLDAGADDYLPKPFDMEELFIQLRGMKRKEEAEKLEKSIEETLTYGFFTGTLGTYRHKKPD